MKDEIHSTSINPDVVEQFLALMNTHCKSSEEALAMLSTLCYNLMVTCMQLQGIDIAERPGKNIH